jgi:hypothetical protein
MTVEHHRSGLPALLGAGLVVVSFACSASEASPSNGGGARSGGGNGGAIADPGAASGHGGTTGGTVAIAGSGASGPNLIDECPGQPKTTVKAIVYDPSGTVPLYNVMLYAPTKALAPIVEGVSCDRCDATASGEPVAAALTNARGEFVMEGVPSGENVPLVIQMGKWRRQIALPRVLPCQDNVFDDKELFRLPRNQSEGHLPRIAMSTGGADKLECVMRRIGVDDSEFTNPDGSGRINLYNESGVEEYAGGAVLPPFTDLLESIERLKQYDVVIMSCHGDSGHGREQPTLQKETIKQYVDLGGRVFGSHFHYSYLRGEDDNHLPTPFPDVGVWDGEAPESYSIDASFPKGQAFAEWLVHVGASGTQGVIELMSVEGAASLLETPYTQRWIYAENSVPYFSMNLPIEKAATPDEQCGRFVHTGIHISGSETEDPFPSGCDDRPLTPQEKALEFLLFELSACPLRIDQEPAAPPVVK